MKNALMTIFAIIGFFCVAAGGLVLYGKKLKNNSLPLFQAGMSSESAATKKDTLEAMNFSPEVTPSKKATTKARMNEVVTENYEAVEETTSTYKKKRGPTVTYARVGPTITTVKKETAEQKLARQENELKGRIQASLINSSFKEREFAKKNPKYRGLVKEAEVALEEGDVSTVNKKVAEAEEIRGTSLKFRPLKKGEKIPMKNPLYGGGN